MARQRKVRKAAGGRGSAEAIEKRRAARQLNALLTGGAKRGDKLDGRTEKRRQRLIEELKDGKRGRALKPIDFVSHVDELLELGETVGSLKRQGVKPRKVEQTSEITETVRRTQEAYNFRPQAWRMLGIRIEGDTSPDDEVEEVKPVRQTRGARKAPGRKKRGG